MSYEDRAGAEADFIMENLCSVETEDLVEELERRGLIVRVEISKKGGDKDDKQYRHQKS